MYTQPLLCETERKSYRPGAAGRAGGVISFLIRACSSPGPIGRPRTRAEKLGAVGLRGGSTVEAAALLVEVLGPLLVLLLAGGGGAAASADRSLSRPEIY